MVCRPNKKIETSSWPSRMCLRYINVAQTWSLHLPLNLPGFLGQCLLGLFHFRSSGGDIVRGGGPWTKNMLGGRAKKYEGRGGIRQKKYEGGGSGKKYEWNQTKNMKVGVSGKKHEGGSGQKMWRGGVPKKIWRGGGAGQTKNMKWGSGKKYEVGWPRKY